MKIIMNFFERYLIRYVIGISVLYLFAAFFNLFVFKFADLLYIQMVWLIFLSTPLIFITKEASK